MHASLPIRDLSTGTPRILTPVSIASADDIPREVSVSPMINDSILCVDDNPLNLKVSPQTQDTILDTHIL